MANMCGIVGVFGTPQRLGVLRQHAAAMAHEVSHRGPDGAGLWIDESAAIALGHRRLSVVDLTPSGSQPMISSSGRYVIVYNGECYDLAGLRADVERSGPGLLGTSDTEVLLEACDRLGLEATLERLVGMFAFALWDRRERRLHLVRDRLGVKPLYVTQIGQVVAFASEVKALTTVPGFDASLDRGLLAAYLRRNCLPDGRSVHPGTQQVSPGTVLTIESNGRSRVTEFWSLRDAVERGRDGRARDIPSGSAQERELVEATHEQLARAVRIRMLADVPLGAFLSGGIDSTSVVALMQAQSARPVRTFTIGSTSSTHDESVFAREVARHLGTDHTELVVSPDDAAALVPAHLAGLDQPFADSSSLPTFLVSQLARQHVTVALSGDGGDEVFGGYTRHRVAAGPLGRLLGLPIPLRRALAAVARSVPAHRYDALSTLLPAMRRPGSPGDQIHKAASALLASDVGDLHRRLTTHWSDPARLIQGASETASWEEPSWLGGSELGAMERMLVQDTLGYLPDDILTKVDRASMSVSLEARVPLLDHRLLEHAWTLPASFRVRDGRTKWVLREVLKQHVPPALTDRPKRGFGQPIGAWLRGPLRHWAEELLSDDELKVDDLFDPRPIRRVWAEHLGERRNHAHLLWDVLAIQAWRQIRH